MSYFDSCVVPLRQSLVIAARKSLRNREDVEDAVQRTMIIAAQRWAEFCADYDDDRGKLARWLHGILRNVVKDILRDLCAHETESLDETTLERIKRAETITDDPALAHSAYERLAATHLPHRQSQALDLFLRGLSRADISAEMEIGQARVCKLLQGAFERLAGNPDYVAAPEADFRIEWERLFQICSDVYVYYPPEKTGAALARQKLAKMR